MNDDPAVVLAYQNLRASFKRPDIEFEHVGEVLFAHLADQAVLQSLAALQALRRVAEGRLRGKGG